MEIKALAEQLETISQGYAERLGFERDGDWFLLKLQEEVGELTQAYLQLTGRARTKGSSPETIRETLDEEVADVLCQLLLFARHHDVDVVRRIAEKWLTYHPRGAGG